MNKAKILAATALVSVSLIHPSQLLAQATDDEQSIDTTDQPTIIVTGSRIARPELEGVAPLVVSMSEEDLEQRAFTNVSEALNSMPGFGTPVSSNGGQSSFSVGQNFVNLFGIGTQRTLTLVNGRRFVSSNTASNFSGANAGLQVDLNVIPLSLVDRIDVLAVAGATTYGSDAVAGTVNVILKQDFEGMEAEGSYGIFEEGDGESIFFSATMGTNFDDDRGNIAFNFEYDRQDGILANNRAILREGLYRSNSSTLLTQRRISVLTRGGLPTRGSGIPGGLVTLGGGFSNAGGNLVHFAPNGNLISYDIGVTAGAVNTSGGDGLNLTNAAQILSDLERYTAYSIGHYDITDNITAYFEANYAHTEAAELANQPVYQSGLFGGDSRGLGMLISNPFLNNQARGVLSRPGNLDGDGDGVADLNYDTNGDGVNDDAQFFLQRAGFDLLGGTNPNFGQLDLFRIVGGLRGDFELGDREFYWDVSYAYGKSQSIATSTSLVQQNFLYAIDAVTDPTTGQIVCRVTIDPPTPLGTSVGTPETTNAVETCLPLNLFGDGVGSADAIDYVTTLTTSESTNIQQIFNANVGGTLFELFGNDFAFNLGYEHRQEQQTFMPDGFLQEGLGRSVAISPVAGSFSTDEFFGEILLPIITPQNDWFIREFELAGSIRFIENSQAGSAKVWSVGGRLSPIRDITFRGSYTESVRAPAITELFLPAVSVFSFASDPCDEDYINAGNVPATRAANCAADGISQPFSSIIDDASQQITSSGNPGLLNETSESWTLGVILQPRFIPNLTLTADWVDISLANAITTLSLTDIMRSCYDNANFPNTPTCGQFTRDGSGQIISANVGFSNAGTFDYAGLQVTARYSAQLADLFGGSHDLGQADLSLSYFYLDQSEFTVAGVLDDDSGEIGDFEHEVSGTLTYSYGNSALSMTGTYLPSAVYDNEDTPGNPYTGVGDYFIVDASISHSIGDMLTLRFTVNNLFEETPPYPSRSTTVYTSGVLGRQFRFGAALKF